MKNKRAKKKYPNNKKSFKNKNKKGNLDPYSYMTKKSSNKKKKKKKTYFNSFKKSNGLSFINSINPFNEKGLTRAAKVSYKKKVIAILSCLIVIIIIICIVAPVVVSIRDKNKNKTSNYFNNFTPLVEMSTLKDAGHLGHNTSLREFEKYNVSNVLAGDLNQDASSNVPTSLWSGLKSGDDTSYITTKINRYETDKNSVTLLFGNSTNKPIWGYGDQNNEDPNLIFQEILKQLQIYSTNKAEFFISKNYSWADKYLGLALNLLLNYNKNISLTIATVSNDKDNQISDYNTVQANINDSYQPLRWNIMPMNFIIQNSEIQAMEDSITKSFDSFSKTYNTLKNNKKDVKTFFSISPTIGYSYSEFNNLKANNIELFDLKTANTILAWGIKNGFDNWGMLSASRDYPGESSSTASGITNQKNGDFCKAFELNLYQYLQNNITGSFKIENYCITEQGVVFSWKNNNSLKNATIYKIYKENTITGIQLVDTVTSNMYNYISPSSSGTYKFYVVASNYSESTKKSNSITIDFHKLDYSKMLSSQVRKFENNITYNDDDLIAYNGSIYQAQTSIVFQNADNPSINANCNKLKISISDLKNWYYSNDAINDLNK